MFLLLSTMASYLLQSDVIGMPFCQGTKPAVVFSLVAMVTDLYCHLTYCSQIISEMLPEIHTMEKSYVLKPIIHFQIISFSLIVSNQIHMTADRFNIWLE